MTEPGESYHEALARFRRELLFRALKAHGGNRTRTARALGLQRTYLLRLIRDYGLAAQVPSARRAAKPPMQIAG
jgi:DNA-binding NtrC family response regulator